MQSITTNGSQASAREMLDTLRQHIERLEAELEKSRRQNEELRADRDECRKMLVDQIRHLLDTPEDWAAFDAKEYSVTSDDLRAHLRSH